MIFETTDLFEYFKFDRGNKVAGRLVAYRHGQMSELNVIKKRPAILVIPGGGYAFVSQREAEPIAMEFYSRGFDSFVLEYDIAPAFCYPAQITEAAMAMVYLRENAEKLDLIPDKIAAVGFSAGGHLLGCISTLWDDPAILSLFGDRCTLVRPDASVYSYPVVTSDPEYYHGGSFRNFCSDKVKHEDYSIEKKVRKECSPAFIWSTSEDTCVPPMNSVLLYEAYLKNGVPCELHIFREGWHGLSTCDFEVYKEDIIKDFMLHVKSWLNLSAEFLKGLGFQAK